MRTLDKREESRLVVLWDYNYKERTSVELVDVKNKALLYFGKQEAYNQMCTKLERDADNAKNFNGNIVMQATPLTGIELGKIIAKFKAEYEIEAMTDDDILTAVNNRHRSY